MRMITLRKGDGQFSEEESPGQKLIIPVAISTAPNSNKNALLNYKHMLADARMQLTSVESIGEESLFYCLPA